jgi:small redox-active disulfide protein 2
MVKIQVLGTGCPKCRNMAETAENAAVQLGLDYEIEKVTDLNEIMDFGVMMTPALAVNGVVKIAGKVPSPEDMRALLN